MATRALIGWIESDAAGNQVLTSTYNHYDGYPENLGVGLNKFYDEPNEALKVANMGYISFLNPETGEIESKHNDPAEKTVLSDDFEEAMREIHAVADSMGADYVYLYDHDENDWMHSKMNGVSYLIKTFSMSGIDNQFNSYGDDQDLGVPGDNALGLEENRSEFDTNKPGRVGEFIKALDLLVYDEYHSELYDSDEVKQAYDLLVKAVKKLEMGREDEMDDMPGFEGTKDSLRSLGLEEDDKDHKHTYKQIDPDGTAECTKCGLRNSDPSKTGEKVVKEGDYNTKFKNFINEGAFDIAIRIKDLMNKLKDEPKEQVKLYIDSVGRDVKRGDIAQYQEMSIDDMVEDYENYIQDKMSS
jgi:hypothetical protein